MAKNDAILLDGILQDRIASEPMEVGDAFEIFAFEQILKSFDLTRQELDFGWVDGWMEKMTEELTVSTLL